MTRQSISFTEPNNDWLMSQIESEEYTSKSEVINDLIRRAREVDAQLVDAQQYQETAEELEWLRKRFVAAEESGVCEMSADEMLVEFKKNYDDGI